MRVQVHIENSEGVEVCVYNEYVRDAKQIDQLRTIIVWVLGLEKEIKMYIETMGEDP